jgi:hypothetical protein
MDDELLRGLVIGLRTADSLHSSALVTVVMGRSVIAGDILARSPREGCPGEARPRQALLLGNLTQLGGACLGFYLVRSFDERNFDGTKLDKLVQDARLMLDMPDEPLDPKS